jgi:phospholipase/carboxylesterase
MSDATKTTGAPSTPESPHQNQPVRTAGATLEDAQAAVVMVHGRGATAESILALAREFAFPDDVCYLAPQAAGRSWYPKSFLAPLAENEPGLSSGLRAIGDAARRATEAGLPAEHTLLLGFSQGACLVSEFAARAPARYGGLALLSGGLIGSGQKAGAEPPEDKHFDYEGDFDGTPAFFGCSDQDPHIPLARVRHSAEVFRALGADVEERIYEGMGHTVNEDELTYVQALLRTLIRASRSEL